jgi:hypothetical protein
MARSLSTLQGRCRNDAPACSPSANPVAIWLMTHVDPIFFSRAVPVCSAPAPLVKWPLPGSTAAGTVAGRKTECDARTWQTSLERV